METKFSTNSLNEVVNLATNLKIEIKEGYFYIKVDEPYGPDDPNVPYLEELYQMTEKRIGVLYNSYNHRDFFDEIVRIFRNLKTDVVSKLTSLSVDEKENYINELIDQLKTLNEDIIETITDSGQKLFDIPKIDHSFMNSEYMNDEFREEIPIYIKHIKDYLKEFIVFLANPSVIIKDPQTKNQVFNKSFNKLKWNGNSNVLIDIFYRLFHEKNINGKPYIETTTENLTEFIYNCFLSKDGKEISKNTIETCLKPGRIEKRPSIDKQFDIDTSLNSE